MSLSGAVKCVADKKFKSMETNLFLRRLEASLSDLSAEETELKTGVLKRRRFILIFNFSFNKMFDIQPDVLRDFTSTYFC